MGGATALAHPLLLWLVTPVTVFIRFFFPWQRWPRRPRTPKRSPPDVEALIEAGEEEGILEQSDRELVRSAVEFGDMLVREVMTPRPEIFAVSESITLERFLELLKQHNYSRVPVYSGSLDNITGLAFAHDLLQITDEDARTRTVATILRPAAFVPETKRGYELLREMQREKQHMRIVIDEYGAVAGLVTIEDLLEADRRQHPRRARNRFADRRTPARAFRLMARSRQLSRRPAWRPSWRAVELGEAYEQPRWAAW